MPKSLGNQKMRRHERRAAHHGPGAENTAYRLLARLLDVVGALVGMIFLWPLLVVAGVWVKLVDGGPILYRQWRVGKDGWLFTLFKLRTMAGDAEFDGQARFASNRDPRILRGCAWMRKSHLDELPQLWNILLGQMTLVGPRPERPEIFESLRDAIPKIEARLLGKPGLTGLAQLRNGYTNDINGARRKLAYDMMYLRNRTTFGDLRLLAATVPKVWDQGAM